MDPAANVRNATLTGSLLNQCPTVAPRKVGPPPIRPSRPRNPQLGRPCSSPASGATMPKPSVALCNPKPMTSTPANAMSPVAADCPIAKPSAKLCSPIPVAISNASRRGPLQDRNPVLQTGSSPTLAAPGPNRGDTARAWALIHRSYQTKDNSPTVNPAVNNAPYPRAGAGPPSLVCTTVR